MSTGSLKSLSDSFGPLLFMQEGNFRGQPGFVVTRGYQTLQLYDFLEGEPRFVQKASFSTKIESINKLVSWTLGSDRDHLLILFRDCNLILTKFDSASYRFIELARVNGAPLNPIGSSRISLPLQTSSSSSVFFVRKEAYDKQLMLSRVKERYSQDATYRESLMRSVFPAATKDALEFEPFDWIDLSTGNSGHTASKHLHVLDARFVDSPKRTSEVLLAVLHRAVCQVNISSISVYSVDPLVKVKILVYRKTFFNQFLELIPKPDSAYCVFIIGLKCVHLINFKLKTETISVNLENTGSFLNSISTYHADSRMLIHFMSHIYDNRAIMHMVSPSGDFQAQDSPFEEASPASFVAVCFEKYVFVCFKSGEARFYEYLDSNTSSYEPRGKLDHFGQLSHLAPFWGDTVLATAWVSKDLFIFSHDPHRQPLYAPESTLLDEIFDQVWCVNSKDPVVLVSTETSTRAFYVESQQQVAIITRDEPTLLAYDLDRTFVVHCLKTQVLVYLAAFDGAYDGFDQIETVNTPETLQYAQVGPYLVARRADHFCLYLRELFQFVHLATISEKVDFVSATVFRETLYVGVTWGSCFTLYKLEDKGLLNLGCFSGLHERPRILKANDSVSHNPVKCVVEVLGMQPDDMGVTLIVQVEGANFAAYRSIGSDFIRVDPSFPVRCQGITGRTFVNSLKPNVYGVCVPSEEGNIFLVLSASGNQVFIHRTNCEVKTCSSLGEDQFIGATTCRLLRFKAIMLTDTQSLDVDFAFPHIKVTPQLDPGWMVKQGISISESLWAKPDLLGLLIHRHVPREEVPGVSRQVEETVFKLVTLAGNSVLHVNVGESEIITTMEAVGFPHQSDMDTQIILGTASSPGESTFCTGRILLLAYPRQPKHRLIMEDILVAQFRVFGGVTAVKWTLTSFLAVSSGSTISMYRWDPKRTEFQLITQAEANHFIPCLGLAKNYLVAGDILAGCQLFRFSQEDVGLFNLLKIGNSPSKKGILRIECLILGNELLIMGFDSEGTVQIHKVVLQTQVELQVLESSCVTAPVVTTLTSRNSEGQMIALISTTDGVLFYFDPSKTGWS